MSAVDQIVLAITVIVVLLGTIQFATYLWQVIVAWRHVRENPAETRPERLWNRYADIAPRISLLVPAHNEEAGIVTTVRSLLSLSYPDFEIIVINDGSSDSTAQALIGAFSMTPSPRAVSGDLGHAAVSSVLAAENAPLILVNKEKGGKADALNAGVSICDSPLFTALDADSVLDPDALMRAVEPFLMSPSEVIATGGTVRVANGCVIRDGKVVSRGVPLNPLALFQMVEYVRAFVLARIAWSRLGALTIVSGAFGVFSRERVVAVGGYQKGAMGEDLDIVVRLRRRAMDEGAPHAVVFVPEAICWTEVPENLSSLGNQRSRWQQGALEAWWENASMTMNPRYGRVGMMGLTNSLIADVLGPIAEVLGYALFLLFLLTGRLSVDYFMAITALVFSYGLMISVSSLTVEAVRDPLYLRKRDLVILTGAAVLENFGYRQICNLWRIRGWWRFLRSTGEWGVMSRKGLDEAARNRLRAE